jgi:hypothetical protein
MRMYALSLAAGVSVSVGCIVVPEGHVAYREPVVEAPVVEVDAPVLVPETYVWDGSEMVGVVNGSYVYLGPGNVWLVCEPFRFQRFHRWEGAHHDWREHAIRNEHYRDARRDHVQPRREVTTHQNPARVEPRREVTDTKHPNQVEPRQVEHQSASPVVQKPVPVKMQQPVPKPTTKPAAKQPEKTVTKDTSAH